MKISIIIPTYNEGDSLKECVASLARQTLKDFEIIVVDDGSSDSTSQTLRDASKTLPNFQLIEQKHKGAGSARNLGVSKAVGKILVFVDTDMTFDKDFLRKLTGPIEKGEAKGTFSKEEYVANWDNVWSRCWNINEGWEAKRRHPKNYPDIQPVFRAVLKSEFDRVGGFTPGGYNDDWSLFSKLEYGAINAPGAVFYHKNPGNLTEVFSHAKWVGKRHYKLGYLGYLGNLIKFSLPLSLITGVYKAIVSGTLSFIIFKIIYDFGVFIGILKFMFTNKGAK